MRNYPAAMREALGSHTIGSGTYSPGRSEILHRHGAIGHPARGCHGKTLMAFLLKLLANLYDPKGGDAFDRILTAMTRITPSV